MVPLVSPSNLGGKSKTGMCWGYSWFVRFLLCFLCGACICALVATLLVSPGRCMTIIIIRIGHVQNNDNARNDRLSDRGFIQLTVSVVKLLFIDWGRAIVLKFFLSIWLKLYWKWPWLMTNINVIFISALHNDRKSKWRQWHRREWGLVWMFAHHFSQQETIVFETTGAPSQPWLLHPSNWTIKQPTICLIFKPQITGETAAPSLYVDLPFEPSVTAGRHPVYNSRISAGGTLWWLLGLPLLSFLLLIIGCSLGPWAPSELRSKATCEPRQVPTLTRPRAQVLLQAVIPHPRQQSLPKLQQQHLQKLWQPIQLILHGSIHPRPPLLT